MQIVPAVAVEHLTTSKVLRGFVPAPEPRIVVLVSVLLLAAILVPFDVRSSAEDASSFGLRAKGPRTYEGANVHTNAVVDVRLPTDRLLVQWLPADENVVGRLAFENSW